MAYRIIYHPKAEAELDKLYAPSKRAHAPPATLWTV